MVLANRSGLRLTSHVQSYGNITDSSRTELKQNFNNNGTRLCLPGNMTLSDAVRSPHYVCVFVMVDAT